MHTIDDGLARQMNDTALALCCELIRHPSVTPEDGGCQTLIGERLEAAGFACQHLQYGEVCNLWAERGSGGPLLVFAGHTDVVPPGPEEQWNTPPFEPTIKDGVLYGRGAADMKGGLAAMVVACEQFVAEHPDHPGRIGLLLTSDEEGPAVNGTVQVVEWLQEQGVRIDYCLLGEPSSEQVLGDVIKNGRRGSLGAVLTVRGLQGHIAYPQFADNPIHKAAPALVALAAETWDKGNAHFPPTTFQISNINGGTGAANMIPGELVVQFNFRFSTEVTAERLRGRTEAILNAHGLGSSPGSSLDYDLEWHLGGEPFITGQGELVNAALTAIDEQLHRQARLSTAGGTSDGRFIAPTGAQVLELGPVNTTIHQANEEVQVEDIEQLTRLYRAIAEKLLLTAGG